MPGFFKHKITSTVSDSFWLFLERTIRVGCLLAGNLLLARYLDVAGFGTYQTLMATVLLLSAVADFGLDALALRELSHKHGAERLHMAEMLTLCRCLLGALLALLLLAASALFREYFLCGIAGTLAVLPLLLFRGLESFDAFAQVSGSLSRLVPLRAFFSLAGLVAKWMLIKAGAAPLTLLLVLPLEYVLGLAPYALALILGSAKPPRGALSRIRPLLREGLPLALSGLTSVLSMRMSHFLMAALIGPASVGIYAAALQIAEVWNLIPMVLYSVLLPRLSATSPDPARYHAYIVGVYRFFLFSGLGIALLTAIAGPLVIPLLFGEKYTASVSLLPILSIGITITFVGVARTLQIVVERKTALHLRASLIGVVAQLAASLSLIPLAGVKGAAIGWAVSAFASVILASALIPGLRSSLKYLLEAVLFVHPRR